jgi:hypothetical protein
MLDFIYDWVIYVVPNWLWWLLMTPLFLFLGFILVGHFWPEIFAVTGR